MSNETTTGSGKADAGAAKSLGRHLPAVARILMGLPLVVFGLNGFLNFIPQPHTPLPEKATAFLTALMNTGYMMQLIGATELVTGVLLLANRFVPLALALFAPFILNAAAFHFVLEPSGRIMAGAFVALELYLAWVYRAAFRPMLAARVRP
jgi:uncharacterized membrane protein YphA (DoxX/SURF4 family)